MKKILLFIMILSGCSASGVRKDTVSSPLRFFFSNEVLEQGNYKIREAAMDKQLAALHVDLGPNQRRELCRGMLLPKRFLENRPYRVLIGKEKPLAVGKHGELRGYYLLDLNKDGEIDLILIANGYFGPTPGFIFLGRDGGRFRYLFDNSGRIVRIEHSGKMTAVRYAYFIIDPSECNVLQTILVDHKTGRGVLGAHQYIASQTASPGRFTSEERKSFAGPVLLRHSAPFSPPVKQMQGTHVMRGDIIAKFPATEAVVLKRKSGWAFVAISVNRAGVETSMHHGMDKVQFDYDKKRTKFPLSRITTWLCGWVRE